ncbi:vitamin K-dependent gamma-carboxylase-like [Eriocheir sinensis]|uniref:vitamin K-dependent gamma-carboxylase-like n=1 Tax=Eriocheir sinensis TaxID=95602 RepID=UPI0021CAC822|nr:vitamin K-dependent gamma-carboxylase-like [Eriocheir sinensis]
MSGHETPAHELLEEPQGEKDDRPSSEKQSHTEEQHIPIEDPSNSTKLINRMEVGDLSLEVTQSPTVDTTGPRSEPCLSPKPSSSAEGMKPQEQGAKLKSMVGGAARRMARSGAGAVEAAAKYLHRPCDPASLAAVRIMFGVLMVLDVLQERGMGEADVRWGDPDACRFPLLPALAPLPLPGMLFLYASLLLGAAGMAAGWRWRASCGVFLLGYWYLLLLDKATWNNHSYLYGLLTALLLAAEPHACWSLDARREGGGGGRHVPFWNYFMLRAQVFFLYFMAGVKKLDPDWLRGHSMRHLGEQWVFAPFRLFVSTATIDYYIIHLGGFLLDLTLGPLLLWPPSRKVTLFFGAAFHLMNSQIFYIGMFPWVCLATLPLFCHCSWPRELLAVLPKLPRAPTPRVEANEREETTNEGVNRVGAKQNQGKKSSDGGEPPKKKKGKDDECKVLKTLKKNSNCFYSDGSGVSLRQKVSTVLVACYLLLQTVLPFSHSITKGFNTWTEGPYGYSWDMMVHSWDTLHVKVTAVTANGGHRVYVDPDRWVSSPRWSSHADMAVQYCRCVQSRLAALGHPVTALYLDVWKSLNGRFQQRIFDPTVNILEAPWSPWSETPWVLPLVKDLDHWRTRLYHQQEEDELSTSPVERIFVADFPGLTLENYLSTDLENVTLEVLKGVVVALLPCEGGGGGRLDDQEPRDGPENITAYQQQNGAGTPAHWKQLALRTHRSHEGLKETSERSSDYEKGTDFQKLLIGCHDLSMSLHRAQKSLKELAASIHVGTKGVSAHLCGAAEVRVCPVVVESGGSLTLPTGAFHSITTTSSSPAVYSYSFTNATLSVEEQRSYMASHSTADEPRGKGGLGLTDTSPSDGSNSNTQDGQPHTRPEDLDEQLGVEFPTFQDLIKFFKRKLTLFWRSGRLLAKACHCVLTNSCPKKG